MIRETKFRALNEFRRKVGHVVWDVDGPIVFKDKPNYDVLRYIARLAKKGIFQSFISGRDANWLIKNLIEPLKSVFPDIADYEKYFIFCPELGTISLALDGTKTINPALKSHPLVRPEVRSKLANLAWQISQIKKLLPGDKIPDGCMIGGDAESNLYAIPTDRDIAPTLPMFIWSSTKDVIGTYEVVRDGYGNVSDFDMKEVVKILEAKIKEFGFLGKVEIAPTRTAIDIAPIIDRVTLNKDVAAGNAVFEVQKRSMSNLTIVTIIDESIAFGDGKTDFKFAKPVDGKGSFKDDRLRIRVNFVGPSTQFDSSFEPLIWLLGEGALEKEGPIGPEVTLQMLTYIEDNGLFESLEIGREFRTV